MNHYEEGTVCPHRSDAFRVGAFCEFCDYVATIDRQNNVNCRFTDDMED